MGRMKETILALVLYAALVGAFTGWVSYSVEHGKLEEVRTNQAVMAEIINECRVGKFNYHTDDPVKFLETLREQRR